MRSFREEVDETLRSDKKRSERATKYKANKTPCIKEDQIPNKIMKRQRRNNKKEIK